MGKENSKINKLYLFLNAVYYCLWLFDIKTQKNINKQIRIVFYPIWLILPEKFKVKYKKNMASQQNEINSYFYDKRNGFHITMAYSYFTAICCMLAISISLILFGLWLKFFGKYNIIAVLIIAFIPIEVAYIPLKKGVFKNERYLKYFKKFEKKDEQWHKKWKRITIAFCLGCIILVILGGLLGLQIAISGL